MLRPVLVALEAAPSRLPGVQVVGGPWSARASNVEIADRLAGKLLLVHGGMDDQVHPDHTLRLADRLIAADKDFELLIVPGAEHTYIDCLAYVRKRCWDFLVRELMGTQPPAYRPHRRRPRAARRDVRLGWRR